MLGNLIITVLAFYLHLSNAITYDTYNGVPLTEERMKELTEADALDTCTIDIETCDEDEGRRLDGSCNNLKNPSHGSYYTPQIRLLDAVYDDTFGPRKSKSGKPLILPRDLRVKTLPVFKSSSSIFNMLMAYFAEFMVTDVVSGRDTVNYLSITTHCCEESGLSDYMCTPNVIPKYDPVHRFSGYKCMNQTRPFSFQNQGCAANNTTPVRMDIPTVTWDLSNLYEFAVDGISYIREFEGGRLKSEIVNGREFTSDGNSSCTIQDAIETGCTRNVPNGFMGTNVLTTLYSRLHNLCARGLFELNPGWTDDKLFDTARDIVIGMYVQMTYYEFWPSLLGRHNMLEKGIILENQTDYRDIYNESVSLQLYVEYPLVNRWFHVTQEGTQYKIAPNGTYVGKMQVVDISLKVEQLAIDDNIVNILHGASIQPGGDHDRTIDPDIADRGLGPLQATIDLCTQDFNKDRLFDTAPYVQYRDLRTGYEKKHESFEDLEYIISGKYLKRLINAYEDVQDIGLLPGIAMENHIEGGHIPDTAAFIIMEQLKRCIIADRHWYERANRPNAFTPVQLQEIRKSTLAGLLCTVGDEFTHIQPKAFLRISPENQVVSCDEIPTLDLSAWKEEATCE